MSALSSEVSQVPKPDGVRALKRFQNLGTKELTVLRRLRDEDEELVYERGRAYIDVDRVSKAVVFSLLRACAISLDSYSRLGGCERYHINGTGLTLLQSANEQMSQPVETEEKSAKS